MKITKRIIVLVITILLIFSFSNVVRAEGSEYGKVTNLSDAEVEITGSETADVELIYNRLKLVWYKAEPSIGRNVDGYWVGYRIDFPEALGGASAPQAEVEKAKYRRKFTGYDWSEVKSFYSARDGQWFMTGWTQITQERLNANDGEFSLFEAEFDWQGDGTYEQKLTIKVNAKNVELDSSNVTTVTIKESGNGASSEERTFLIQTGKSLNEGLIESELDEIEGIRNKEGFVKFYKEGAEDEEFSFDEAINEKEITIIAQFDAEITEPEPEDTTPEPEPEEPKEKDDEKDDTPKTGGFNFVGYVATITVVSAIGIIIIRKKNYKE